MVKYFSFIDRGRVLIKYKNTKKEEEEGGVGHLKRTSNSFGRRYHVIINSTIVGSDWHMLRRTHFIFFNSLAFNRNRRTSRFQLEKKADF